MDKQNDPLPTSQKFCFYFELKPSVGFYITFEYILWILLLLSAVNLEIDCLETTDLNKFEEVLRKDLFYNIIFGVPDTVPHENVRAATIFLNSILVIIFLLYFLFTPLLLVGMMKSSPNWFIPYLIYDIVMINLSGCFFIVAIIVWNLRMFWLCFIFFALKLNSAIAVFSIYKREGGKVTDSSELSYLSGVTPATTMESLCEAVDV
ncbi:hypothetical protein PVAND_005702 [Polypedilum vanderplanki]|uniref:Uncharacterized protein n=1 Tax=Polypedilum vanderplanki TaxID=319348 RepID=A0A9J6C1R7_POLVA|nr:hypothetical protein PVAND_005702 [Polypedilum vanderplanki]